MIAKPQPTSKDIDYLLRRDVAQVKKEADLRRLLPGMISLATDSLGETFSGDVVERNRKRHHDLRQRLQQCGSRQSDTSKSFLGGWDSVSCAK